MSVGDGAGADSWRRRRASFGTAADDYAAGRPPYPEAAVRWGLPEGATVALDLAAGTGILTAGLLALGLQVVAVEPLPAMRALIPAPARALDGTAESIPLPDASVDAAFVGQAWHWFDTAAALTELRRVVRPGGTIALLWNLLDTSDPLTAEIADILEAEERSDMMLDHADPPYPASTQLTRPERRAVRHAPTYDSERLVAFARSRSQAILLEPEQRAALVRRLRAAVPDGRFPLPLVCEVWRGYRTDAGTDEPGSTE